MQSMNNVREPRTYQEAHPKAAAGAASGWAGAALSLGWACAHRAGVSSKLIRAAPYAAPRHAPVFRHRCLQGAVVTDAVQMNADKGSMKGDR